jgi:hypothetical protein
MFLQLLSVVSCQYLTWKCGGKGTPYPTSSMQSPWPAGHWPGLARSAFPDSTMKNILVEEEMRRLRNCSLSLPWNGKKGFLNTLAISMMGGGGRHEENVIFTVMTRVIGKYEANQKNHFEGRKVMYRSRSEREEFYEGGKGKLV